MINEGDDGPDGYVFGRILSEAEWKAIMQLGNGASHVDEHGVRRLLIPRGMDALRAKALDELGFKPREITGETK